jgi:drug/metabolite transporter (DMT)-like permease
MTTTRSNLVSFSPYVLLSLAVLFWAGNFILGRAVRADVPPIALAFWRWAIASLLICGPAFTTLKRDWATIGQHWPILLLLAGTGVAAFNTLVYLGLQHTVAINALLMQTMMPVMIVALSFVLFRERINRGQAGGVILCLMGAIAIIVQGDVQVMRNLSFNPGDLLVLLAVINYAGYTALLRRRPAIHPLSFLVVTFVVGTLMLLPFYLWESLMVRPIAWNAVSLLSVSYVSIFPSVISFLCYNRGVELIGANRAGLFLYLMPVFGGTMAVFFLGESIRWFHWAGVVLIATGIVTTLRAGQ